MVQISTCSNSAKGSKKEILAMKILKNTAMFGRYWKKEILELLLCQLKMGFDNNGIFESWIFRFDEIIFRILKILKNYLVP